jgi:MFS family permease
MASPASVVQTDIPARLDRLAWNRFHLLVVVALGVTWVLDGLEVTIVGSIGPVLQSARTLSLTPVSIGAAASAYVVGAVIGALLFGWITDWAGRRRVFFVTLAVYVAGVLLSACAWNFWSFALFRVVTGLGIGGEYAAINSTIDELIPARYRGRVDLIVNGSFWLGAAAGAAASVLLLDARLFPPNVGWRLGFAIGGVLGLSILLLRRIMPESPRWLVTHCRGDEAEATMARIEAMAPSPREPAPALEMVEVRPRRSFPVGLILKTMLGRERARSLLVLTLMVAQAFLFNAVFFTYGVVLTRFDGVPDTRVGAFLLPLTLGSFCGPLLLAHLFDTVGRKVMIAATYGISGLLLIGVSVLFVAGALNAFSQTAGWAAIFFFASAAGSAAYLTASEIFPIEMRPLAIACFYALGTAIGGIAAPMLFGALIASGSRLALASGYLVAAVLMILAALAEIRLGVDAEGKPLERISEPLSLPD